MTTATSSSATPSATSSSASSIHAAGFAGLSIQPLAGALGAEISGVDLSRPLDDATVRAIRQALLRYDVVFFRGQNLTPRQQIEFAGRFAPFSEVPYIRPMAEYPELIEVVREAGERKAMNFGGHWHSDLSFMANPPLGSVLYAVEVPPFGGDTMWSSMHAAYEALSDGLKKMLEGLRVMHSARRSYAPGGTFADDDLKSMRIDADENARKETAHPSVRVHPESGKKCLFINPVYAIRFEGWTEEESAPLLAWLDKHCQRPEFTCRFNWSAGALAFWDNRSTQHFAINDYRGFRRQMRRVTLAGDRPFGVEGRPA